MVMFSTMKLPVSTNEQKSMINLCGASYLSFPLTYIDKQSKRMPARRRYKIEKKVRDHNRKLRKQAKDQLKSKSRSYLEVPIVLKRIKNVLSLFRKTQDDSSTE